MVDTFFCAKAAVFYNPKGLTQAEIFRQTGCTHILNGWVFNRDFQACNWLVVEGNVLSRDPYSDWGFACGKAGAPSMNTDRSESFLSAVPLLKDGARLQRALTPDVARPAERSAVGWLPDGRVLLWCGRAQMTREALQEELLAAGCTDALMLDGGGSVQGIFPGGSIRSSRRVLTHLLFWEADITERGEEHMLDIHAYSKSKEGNKNLTEHFKVREFACKDGSDAIFVARGLPMVLQSIRSHFGAPVTIHSGYRTPTYNQKVGGAALSQHCYGTAADISVKGVPVEEVAKFAESLMPTWGGVGRYPSQGFVHVDVREEKSRWMED